MRTWGQCPGELRPSSQPARPDPASTSRATAWPTYRQTYGSSHRSARRSSRRPPSASSALPVQCWTLFFVQRQLLGARRVSAGAKKPLQHVALPRVRLVIDRKTNKRRPRPAPSRVNICTDERDGASRPDARPFQTSQLVVALDGADHPRDHAKMEPVKPLAKTDSVVARSAGSPRSAQGLARSARSLSCSPFENHRGASDRCPHAPMPTSAVRRSFWRSARTARSQTS